MNSFSIALNSAAHTAKAVIRKGIRDTQITYDFFTDEEMIKLYSAIWQSLYGVSMLMYGLGVLSRRAMDRFIMESLAESEESSGWESSGWESESWESSGWESESWDSSGCESSGCESSGCESDESESILEECISNWKSEALPVLMDAWKVLTRSDMERHLKGLGYRTRVSNRRLNKAEMTEIYQAYLDSL